MKLSELVIKQLCGRECLVFWTSTFKKKDVRKANWHWPNPIERVSCLYFIYIFSELKVGLSQSALKHTEKVSDSIFFYSHEIILFDYLEHSKTILQYVNRSIGRWDHSWSKAQTVEKNTSLHINLKDAKKWIRKLSDFYQFVKKVS